MVNWQRGVMRLMRITNHPVTVTGVEDFNEIYRRIHFSGPELLSQLDEVFPTLWTRLWFPHPEKGEGHLSQRGYTFSAIDLEVGAFSLDFVLHGADDAEESGPGARWAAGAEPGCTIEAALTPARLDLPADTSRLLLAGDLTALPAINTWLDAVPAEVAVTVAVAAEPEETPGLPRTEHPNARWSWVTPGPVAEVEQKHRCGRALTAHLRELDLSAPGLYVWAAGERGLVKDVRSFAKHGLGLGRSQLFSQFYWFADKPTG